MQLKQSVVGIVTRQKSGVRIPALARKYSLQNVQTGSGTHPIPTQWIPAFILGRKSAAVDAGYSLPHSVRVDVKNGRSYTSTPPYAFTAQRGATFRCRISQSNYVKTPRILSCPLF